SFISSVSFSRKLSLVIGRRAEPTTANWRDRRSSFAKLYRAGMSLRLVKSPDAPKITITQGSPGRPTGSSITCASSPDPRDLGLCITSNAGSDRLADQCIRLPSVVLPWLLRPGVRQGFTELFE